MEPTPDLETDEEMKDVHSQNNGSVSNVMDSSQKHLKVDSLSVSLQPSRKNSSTHLEIRKATLMEQESLLDKMLQGDVSDEDDDSMSAMDELARQKRLQELIVMQWEVIDTEDNADVDVNEWKTGMKKLKVSLTDEQMEALFKLLDEEEVGFVDRQSYQAFVIGNYDTDYLTELQQPLIRLARRMNRQRKEKEQQNQDEDDGNAHTKEDDESGEELEEDEKEEEEEDEELKAMRNQLNKEAEALKDQQQQQEQQPEEVTLNREPSQDTFDKHLKNGSSQNETGSVVVHNSVMGSTQLSAVGLGLFGSDQLHEASASSLLNPKSLNTFDVMEADGLQKEMEAELKKQASALKLSLLKEKQYLQEIEEIANTKEDFLIPEKAMNWTPEEVALWLDEMGMAKYGQHIVEDGVDGSILLNDVTKQVLLKDICVHPLHVGKILRAIDKLRQLNSDHLETPYKDWNVLNETNKKIIQELETSHQQINNTQKQIRDLETEIQQLKLAASTNTITTNTNTNTIGLDINEEATNDISNSKEAKLTELQTQIDLHKSQLERVCREKIDLTIATSEEISHLRTAIKVLQNEQIKPSYLSRVGNPIDSLAGALGYSKAK